MNINTFLRRLFQTPIPRLATVTLFALAWSSLAFCDEIHDVAKAGDLAKVKALLKENPNLVLSKEDKEGRTPLHLAALEGRKDVVELLLASKADVNAKDNKGDTPSHDAASAGHQDVAELLLASKAEPNAKGNLGPTPSLVAAASDHKDVAELPAQQGGQEISTPIQPAPTASGKRGTSDTAMVTGEIYDAAGVGNLAKVQALLKSNPDLVSSKDNQYRTPLHYAADSGQKAVAELLLANGADVNAKDKNGWTPLHWAAERGHKNVAQLLLASKADVNAKNSTGATPLHFAAASNHKDVAELLLANGADVDATNSAGVTPLHWAALYGNKAVAELLRQHGGHE